MASPSPSAGHRFTYEFSPARIGRLQSFKETISADLQELGYDGKRDHGESIAAPFYPAHSLPVNADQFGETLLGHARLDACFADIPANSAEHFTFGHVLMRNTDG